jgi:solute carrier family 29 (equilibrative nucleoside transporter), member 1/2/3
MDPSKLILVSWVITSLVLLMSSLLALFVTSLTPNSYFYATMFLGFVAGAFSGALQNSLYALAANLPPVFFQAISFGQGFVGLSTSLLILAARSMHEQNPVPTDISAGTFGFFFIGFLLCVASFASFYYFMTRSSYYRYYLGGGRTAEEKKGFSELPTNGSEESLSEQLRTIFLNSPSRWYPISIWFVFFITFSVFPGFLAATQSSLDSSHAEYRKMFITLGFLAFDLSDSIGKFLPGMHCFFIQSHTLAITLNLFRIVFVPLFMCFNFPQLNLNGDPFFPSAPRWIQSDAAFFIIVLAFGLSNGYFGSLVLMKAAASLPEAKSSPTLREKMGKIMGLFLGLGLITGPCIAFALQAILA